MILYVDTSVTRALGARIACGLRAGSRSFCSQRAPRRRWERQLGHALRTAAALRGDTGFVDALSRRAAVLTTGRGEELSTPPSSSSATRCKPGRRIGSSATARGRKAPPPTRAAGRGWKRSRQQEPGSRSSSGECGQTDALAGVCGLLGGGAIDAPDRLLRRRRREVARGSVLDADLRRFRWTSRAHLASVVRSENGGAGGRAQACQTCCSQFPCALSRCLIVRTSRASLIGYHILWAEAPGLCQALTRRLAVR